MVHLMLAAAYTLPQIFPEHCQPALSLVSQHQVLVCNSVLHLEQVFF